MKSDYHRLPLTLPPDMVEWLDKKSLHAKVTGGGKLAKTEIIRAMVAYFMEVGLDTSGCKDEYDLAISIVIKLSNASRYC